jgi:hypothetical protein
MCVKLPGLCYSRGSIHSLNGLCNLLGVLHLRPANRPPLSWQDSYGKSCMMLLTQHVGKVRPLAAVLLVNCQVCGSVCHLPLWAQCGSGVSVLTVHFVILSVSHLCSAAEAAMSLLMGFL